MPKSKLESLVDLIAALGYMNASVAVRISPNGYRIECSCDPDAYTHAEGATIEEAAEKRLAAFSLRAERERISYARSISTIDRIFPPK